MILDIMMMFCLCVFLCPDDLNQVSYAAAVKWWSCWLCSRSSAPLSIAGMMMWHDEEVKSEINDAAMNKRHDKYQLIVGKLQHDSSPDRTSDFSLSTLEKMKHTTSSSSSKLKFSLFFARSCSKGRKTHTRGFSLSQHTRTRRCWLEPIKKRAQLDGFAHMLYISLINFNLTRICANTHNIEPGREEKLFSEVHGRLCRDVVSGKAHLSRRLSAAWTDDRNLSPWLIGWLVWMVWQCISRQIFVNWISSRLNISFFRHETHKLMPKNAANHYFLLTIPSVQCTLVSIRCLWVALFWNLIEYT